MSSTNTASPHPAAAHRETGRVLVAGIGNLFFGDDGFGPEVVRRLAQRAELPEHVRIVDYGIRGLHLAYDLLLEGYDALVLVDALPGTGDPGDIRVLRVGEDDLGAGSFDPHGMTPVAVLASLDQLGGTLPPTYVVGAQPLRLDEGIELSAPIEAAVTKGQDVVLQVLAELEVA